MLHLPNMDSHSELRIIGIDTISIKSDFPLIVNNWMRSENHSRVGIMGSNNNVRILIVVNIHSSGKRNTETLQVQV